MQGQDDKDWKPAAPLTVKGRPGETCLCRKTGTVRVGWSTCQRELTIYRNHCTLRWTNGTSVNTLERTCSNIAKSVNRTALAVMWICGNQARHELGLGWAGCCYPGVLSTMSEGYKSSVEMKKQPNLQRQKRDPSRGQRWRHAERIPGKTTEGPMDHRWWTRGVVSNHFIRGSCCPAKDKWIGMAGPGAGQLNRTRVPPNK